MERQKLKLKNIVKHFCLVTKHRFIVLKLCTRCGLFWRGLVHDLSKYSPCEFFESARYYVGNCSPILICRNCEGYSKAWLHHTGRNRHHVEYWYDAACAVQPLIPYKYAVEIACDKLSANKVYNGKNYTPDKPYEYWLKEYKNSIAITNPKIIKFLTEFFYHIKQDGEKAVLNKKFLKKLYSDCVK